MTARQPYLDWSASRGGIRHAFHKRRSTTLCHITVNQQFTRPDQPKCADCLRIEQEEIATARR